MIGIRAEGNETIGIGHIMRCLTLADAFRAQGESVLFLSNSCHELLHKRGYDTVDCPLSFDSGPKEEECMKYLLKEHGISLLIVDGYQVTKEYLSMLKKMVHLAYIDDVNAFDYPVDDLINYNVFATEEFYGNSQNSSLKKYFLGPAYAPVRPEFSTIKKQSRSVVYDGMSKCIDERKTAAVNDLSVLISVGGTDAGGLSYLIAGRIKEMHPGWKLHVLCGPFSRQKEALEALNDRYGGVYIHCNIPDVWEVMKLCDVAVSAGGSTMYELATMEKAIVTFYFVENQRRIAEGFAQRNGAISLGAYTEENRDEFLNALSECLETLWREEGRIHALGQRAGELVDGCGAARLAKALLSECRNR